MENKMNKPVDVICYGTREHFETRKEARDKYAEAMAACEGSEQQRYVKIYLALAHGTADVVTDGSTERVENEPAVKFTLEDKDKIVNFILADVLNINSPEIYDRGTCKLVVEDRDIVKALLKKDGWYAAQSLRKYIENDKELILEAARGGEGDRGALAYASDELRDDKEFVLELIKIDASDVRYVSDRLANDAEVISVALEHAETDYDVNSIKEVLGKELLTEMVQAQLDKQQDKNSVEVIKSEARKEFWSKLTTTHGRKMHGSDFSGEFWDKAILVEDGDNLLKAMAKENVSLAQKIAEAEKENKRDMNDKASIDKGNVSIER